MPPVSNIPNDQPDRGNLQISLISGIPSSWPGYDLEEGSSGEKVRQLQEQINEIYVGVSSIAELN